MFKAYVPKYLKRANSFIIFNTVLNKYWNTIKLHELHITHIFGIK